jgi:hypothetical protein
MGTFYEDEMLANIRQKEMLQAAEQGRLGRLAKQGQDKVPSLLALAIARFKLEITTLSSPTAGSARVSPKLPLKVAPSRD